MQLVRLWEIVSDKELREIQSSQISFESQLEGWLEADISVLDPDLLVIGRQVPTDYGGVIDLLCLDSEGNPVVVELKKGRTPRDVASQALEYAAWVKDLSQDRIVGLATEYLKAGSLASEFRERFEKELPDNLNAEHRSLIVAESMDASTERIVRYLSDYGVPINVATVQHYEDRDGRRMLAQVYLMEPESTTGSVSRRSRRNTLDGLQRMADEHGIGELYARIRSGVGGILSARAYTDVVWYRLRREDGSRRTALIVDATPDEKGVGLSFTLHATRLEEFLGVSPEALREWLRYQAGPGLPPVPATGRRERTKRT